MPDTKYSIGLDTSQFSGPLAMLSGTLQSFAGNLAAMGASAAIGGLGNLGKLALTSADQIETLRIGLTTLTGSASEADGKLTALQALANKSPFEMPSLATATQQLMGMGVASEAVIPMVEALSNAAAASGNMQNFERMALAMGQMQAKGKVSAEEMSQLGEAGIGAWPLLAQAMGTTEQAARKAVQAGSVSAAILPQLATAMQAKFGGAADAMSKTLTGRLSTISDSWNQTAAALGAPINQSLGPLLGELADYIASLAPAAADFGNAMGAAINTASAALANGSLGSLLGNVLTLGAAEGVNWLAANLPKAWTAAVDALGEGIRLVVDGYLGQGLADMLAASAQSLGAGLVSAAATFLVQMETGMDVIIDTLTKGMLEAVGALNIPIVSSAAKAAAANYGNQSPEAMARQNAASGLGGMLNGLAIDLEKSAAASLSAASRGPMKLDMGGGSDIFDTKSLRDNIAAAIVPALKPVTTQAAAASKRGSLAGDTAAPVAKLEGFAKAGLYLSGTSSPQQKLADHAARHTSLLQKIESGIGRVAALLDGGDTKSAGAAVFA